MNDRVYDCLDVANYIVNYCIDIGNPVSNLKLQKLLFYVQAASLVERNKPMFKEEINAWKYGPVVERVYHNFKMYINKAIDEKVVCKNSAFFTIVKSEYDPSMVIEAEHKRIINNVILAHKTKSAIEMVRKTHREKPWQDAFSKNDPFILKEDIKKFYSTEEGKRLIYEA